MPRSVHVDLIARIQNYVPNVKAAGQATKDFRSEVRQLRKDHKETVADIERGATIIGAALLGVAAWATKVTMDFDKQMSEVKAITGEAADGMKTLRQAALDAGQATIFSATEAAEAEANLAKAGLTAAEILGGGLAGALALAAAGSLDLATAADIAANSMMQFHLQGSELGRVADLLAGGANATSTDVEQLGQALTQGGSAAHAAGLSFEDTVTVLSALARQAATVGSDAGTSLKTALLRLSAPAGEAAAVMKQYGISLYDANGQSVTAYELAEQLHSGLKNLTDAKRNEVIATVFGSDAQRVGNSLYALGAEGLHKLNGEINDQADAAAVAATKTDNLSGDLEALTGALETLFITSSEGNTGPLRILVQTFTHLLGFFQKFPPPVQFVMSSLATLTGIVLLTAAAYSKLSGAMAANLAVMAAAGPWSARAARGISLIGTAAKTATVSMLVFITAAEILARTTDINIPGFTQLENRMHAVANAHGRAAAEAARQAEEQKTLAKSMADTVYEGKSLLDVWRQLHGLMMNADEAALEANKRVKDVGESFDKNGKKIKGNSTAALENRIALEKAAEAAVAASQAYLDNGGTIGGAEKKLEAYKKAAEDAAVANGANREEVHKLIEELYKMPASKTVDVNVELRFGGASPAQIKAKLNNLQLARGGIVHSYASGGEEHQAQISRGVMRIWSEPETGGEAYIPLANDRRARSLQILGEVNRKFGDPLGGGSIDYNRLASAVAGAVGGMSVTLDGQAVGRIQGRRADVLARTP